MEKLLKEIIPKKLRELRAKLRLTQEELSSRSGVSRAKIQSYESGYRKPDIDTLILLLHALNADLCDLREKSELEKTLAKVSSLPYQHQQEVAHYVSEKLQLYGNRNQAY
jgi:transcriptional regulator with XRE-family HTH domain